jgi:hypothetical protein
LVLTWKNGRLGESSISKILDRFFVEEDLIGPMTRYRSWVESTFISDHAPVLLQLDIGIPKTVHPFKFNLIWLGDKSFTILTREVWFDSHFELIEDPQRRLVEKLALLKRRVKIWSKFKLKRDKELLIKVEGDLECLYTQKNNGSTNDELDLQCKHLEGVRNKLLLDEEERWRQKSRATWIKSGDKNTKFFHRFASYRRNKKYLWEITDEDGHLHTDQEVIKSEVVNYFSTFFNEQGSQTYRAQLETIRLYPRIVLEEEVTTLEKVVSLEELSVVLKGFAKDKSLGPDGWTVEFFLFFFDLVGPDLLAMVEDTRCRGEVCRTINSTFLALIPKSNRPLSFSNYRPIALCNLCYNIVTNIITRRIRPILSRSLSEEQLGFLKGR